MTSYLVDTTVAGPEVITPETWDARCVVNALLSAQSGIRLDIGCGENKQPGFVGLDNRPLEGVDIVWDAEKYPWPLPDGCVLTAVASHLVEHINPHRGGFLRFMDEVWRVLQPEGDLAIVTPHGSSQGYLQDPTHCNPCNENTWFYFTPGHPLYEFYKPKPWGIKYRVWSPSANIEIVMVKNSVES